jgi:hypothetical protein
MNSNFYAGDFSIFENWRETNPIYSRNLLDWYEATINPPRDLKDTVIHLRSQPDKAGRDEIKALLPCASPAATLKSRAKKIPDNEKLITYSGLMQFDIDHLTDPEAAKKKICQLSEVCFCAVSVSGFGVYGFVPISDPERLKEHFEALKAAFKNFGFHRKLDEGKGGNFTDLRVFSYDPEAYLNLQADTFTTFPKPKPEQPKKPKKYGKPINGEVRPIEAFNQNNYIPDMLTASGWTIYKETAEKVLLRRPGKSESLSADYSKKDRVLFNYSTAPEAVIPANQKGGHAYSPFDIYLHINNLTFEQGLKNIKTTY